MPSYQLGETFDLGRAYSQAQDIKASKKDMEYRDALMAQMGKTDPLDALKLQVEQERLKQIQNPKENPDTPDIANDRVRFVSALFHGAYSQKDPEAARQSTLDAINIAMQHGSIYPEEGKRLIDGLSKVPANQIHPMLKAKFDEMDKMVSSYDKKNAPAGSEETFGTGKENIVKIDGKYYRLGSRGTKLALEGYEPEADNGSDSTAPESLIFREVAAAYGGMYDPKTGEFAFTDPKSRSKALADTAKASRYLKAHPNITPSEAAQWSVGNMRPEASIPNDGPPGSVFAPNYRPRQPQAAPGSGYAQEGDIVSNGKQRLRLQNGQWVPVP